MDIQGLRGVCTPTMIEVTGEPEGAPVKIGSTLPCLVLFADPDYSSLEVCVSPDVVRAARLASNLGPIEEGAVVRGLAVSRRTEFEFNTYFVQFGPWKGKLVMVPSRKNLNDGCLTGSDMRLGGEIDLEVRSVLDDGSAFGVMVKKRMKRQRNEDAKEETASKRPRKSSEDSQRSRKGSESEVEPLARSGNDLQGSETRADPGWDEDFNPWSDKQTSKRPAVESAEEGDSSPKKAKKHLTKKEVKELDKYEQMQIERQEKAVLQGLELIPESEDDYEKLLMGSPNSSLCWIRYMAFMAEKGHLEKARKIADRAFERIHYREEQERLNVHLALFNLELTLGAPDKADEVLTKALKFHDQYKVLERVASIYEEGQMMEKAEETLKKLVRKFRLEKEVWLKLGAFYFKKCDLKAARFTLQRSLQSDNLEKKHHVEVTSKFAQMEFKMGDVERGKTVFEKILSNYPQRTDLWSVYVDMLVKADQLDAARVVLDRMIMLNLQPKKMKFFFKKYLGFEEKHGDAQSVNKVKKKAQEYVEAKVGGIEDENEDE